MAVEQVWWVSCSGTWHKKPSLWCGVVWCGGRNNNMRYYADPIARTRRVDYAGETRCIVW